MSLGGVSGLGRSSLTRLLLIAVLRVAFTITSASARAQVIGANGMNGADCFTDGCTGGDGAGGDSVTAGNAVGGDGGAGGNALFYSSFSVFGIGGNGGNGGAANATAAGDANATGGTAVRAEPHLPTVALAATAVVAVAVVVERQVRLVRTLLLSGSRGSCRGFPISWIRRLGWKWRRCQRH
jgi:hypothetical protein